MKKFQNNDAENCGSIDREGPPFLKPKPHLTYVKNSNFFIFERTENLPQPELAYGPIILLYRPACDRSTVRG
jgi:hypothetical protein